MAKSHDTPLDDEPHTARERFERVTMADLRARIAIIENLVEFLADRGDVGLGSLPHALEAAADDLDVAAERLDDIVLDWLAELDELRAARTH
jgi:hypothetical protein